MHGALVTAVSPKAMEQALRHACARKRHGVARRPAARRHPPVLIFDTVLNAHHRARLDRRHAAQDLRGKRWQFAGEGKVASHFSWDKLENINAIFDRMKEGKIDGRIVLDLAA